MKYKKAWYYADIVDYELVPEPKWDSVPSEKLELVRNNYECQKAKLIPERCKLWGPQIEFYLKRRELKIEIIGEVSVVEAL